MGKVKIQEFMTRNGLAQQGLADIIGVKMELVGDWNTGRADVTRENLAKLFSEGMYFDEAFGDEIKLEKRPEIADEEIKDTAALVVEGLVKIISMAKNSSKSKTE